jgi:hypothetical protein
MDDYERILQLAEMIVEMASISPELWLGIIDKIYAPIPPNKQKAVTWLFRLMSADERLNACLLVALYKAGRLSDQMIDHGLQRNPRTFLMVLIIVS